MILTGIAAAINARMTWTRYCVWMLSFSIRFTRMRNRFVRPNTERSSGRNWLELYGDRNNGTRLFSAHSWWNPLT
jgi:hypothetical protein